MRLSLDCWLLPYLAPGGGHPLNTRLSVTVLCVHRVLGHLGTSLIWHWDRAAFRCQALTCHSPHLDASTTAPCARRPWCYHPSVRERGTGQGVGMCHHHLQDHWCQQVFMYWTKKRQQWLGSFRVWSWKVLSASTSHSSHWKLLRGWKMRKEHIFSSNYLSQGSLSPELIFLALKAVFKGSVSISRPGTGVGHGCSYTTVPWRPWSQTTVTTPAMTSPFTPLNRENCLCKVAGVPHRPLWTCCWQNSQKLTGHFELATDRIAKSLLGPAGIGLLCYAPDSWDNPEKPEGCSGMRPVHSQPREKGHLSSFLLSSDHALTSWGWGSEPLWATV